MMRNWIDQTGYSLEVLSSPQRIVSLVPSITELLYSLGLGDRVVGITKFCVHPQEWFSSKTKIGGTKKIHHELIHILQPDLIIANKEENQKEDVEKFRALYPVFTTDVITIRDAIEMIEILGEVVDKKPEALHLSHRLRQDYTLLQLESELPLKPRALYLIWEKPRMAAGSQTFIHQMMQMVGLENIISGRYPEIDDEALQALNPEYILLSSEPFPYKEKHLQFYQSRLPKAKVRLVDGEYFSWYGSRMLQAVSYFRTFKSNFK